jgi:phosphotransferase system HPr (HPr) family protein
MSEPSISAVVSVRQSDGWHARPASEFVALVQESGLEVTVSRLGHNPVRGDSVLTLLTLGLKFGEQLEISVRGENAQALLAALKSLF